MKSNKKKTIAVIVSICLVLAIGAGATFAYYVANAGSKTNTFTFVGPSGMTAELDETFTPADALNLTPGAVVNKAPFVTNNSTADIDEWVAVKVAITDKDGNLYEGAALTEVLGVMGIDWAADVAGSKWVRAKSTTSANNTQYFYYNEKLAKAATTDNLFTKVTVSDSASDTAMTNLQSNGFKIVVTGCAVQGEAFEDAAAVATDLNGTTSTFTFA